MAKHTPPQTTQTTQTGMAAFLTAPEAGDAQAALRNIALSALREDPENSRKTYSKESLAELAQSIQAMGLLEPIIVRPDPEGTDGQFMVISGHRRFRACQSLGLPSIPAIVRQDMTEEQVPLAAVIENLQREDLIPWEQAQAFNRVLASGAMNRKELAQAAGITENTLRDRLKLLEFGPEVGSKVGIDGFSLAHAKLLLPLADAEVYAGLGSPQPKKGQDPEAAQAEADQALRNSVLQTAIKAIGTGKDTVLVDEAPEAVATALQDKDLAMSVEKDRKLIQDAPTFLPAIKKNLRHALVGDHMVVFQVGAYKEKRSLYKAQAKGKAREAGSVSLSKADKAKASARRAKVNEAAETQMRDAILKTKLATGASAWCVLQEATARPITGPEVDFALRFANVTDEKAQTAFRGLFARGEGSPALGDTSGFRSPTKWWDSLTETQQCRLVFGLYLANQVHMGHADGLLRHLTGKTITEWRTQVDAEVKDDPEPVEQIAP